MAGIVLIRVLLFLLLAACCALCQQPEDKSGRNSLPDAPSVQAPPRSEQLSPLANESHALESVGILIEIKSGAEVSSLARTGDTRPVSLYLGSVYESEPLRQDSGKFFEKYLTSPWAKRNVTYHPATSGSLVSRAAYATSNLFVVRDDSGKSRLNTSYFLAVLSSVAVHTAHRPYWNRPMSAPVGDFGATIGNDAGMDLLHEFGPGLHQLVKSHGPRFVSKIEDRIAH
jgi:hypothetical protein